MAADDWTSVSVRAATRDRLRKRADVDTTYDALINRLLDGDGGD